jgi:hypothetical protein
MRTATRPRRRLARGAPLAILAILLAVSGLPVHPAAAVLVGPPQGQWAVVAASGQLEPEVHGYDHDASGNAFVFGTMTRDTTFAGASPVVLAMPPATNTPQGIIASFDASGDVRWAQAINSSIGVSPTALTVAPDGTSHMLFTIFGTTTFGTGPGAITVPVAVYGAYPVLATFDPSGVPVRAAIMDPSGFLSAIDLTVSAAGEVSVLTTYSPGSTMPTTLTPPGAYGVMVIRYDAAGAFRWALPTSGGNATIWDGHVVDDGAGNVVVAEAAEGTFTLGTGPGAGSFNLTHADVVIARIGPNGAVQWTRTRGGAANDHYTRLALSPSGSIRVAWNEDPSFGSGDEVWKVAGYTTTGTNSWNQTVTGGFQMGFTVTSLGLTVATYRDGATFGTPPDQAVVATPMAIAAFDTAGALAWAGSPGSYMGMLDAHGPNIGVAGDLIGAASSTTVGEGSGAITVNAVAEGNLVLGELAPPTGLASNLAVSIDPQPLALTSGSSTTTRVTVRNTGSSATPAAHVALATGTGISIASTAPSQGSVTGTDWSAGTITAGASAFVDVTVTADSITGCLTPDLTATSTFAGYDTNTVDSSASAPVRVTGTLTLPTGADWVQAGGSIGRDESTAGVADPRGGMIVAGSVSASAVFGDDATATHVLVPPDGVGFYVASYDSNGALRSFTGGHSLGPLNYVHVDDVDVDASGAVTASGSFAGELTFDQSTPTKTLTAPTSNLTNFLSHWNPDGTLAWAMIVTARHVAVAPAGEIFIGGSNLVSRYTSAGALVWTRGFSAQSYAVIDDLVVDSSLLPVVVGDHGGNLAVGAFSIVPFGSFMTRLGTDGVPQWLNPVTPRASTSMLAIMAGGDIIRDHTGTNGGAFVERYSPTGVLAWSRQVTTSLPSANSAIAMPITTSPDGGVFIGGAFFSPSLAQPSVTKVGSGAGWFARLDGTGTIVSLVATPGLTRALDVDSDGHLLVAGTFAANPFVNLGACTVKQQDAYVAKFAPAFLAPHLSGTVTDPSGSPAAGVTVTIMGTWPSWTIDRTLVTDAAGHFDATMNPGTYRVRFFDGLGRFTREWWHSKGSYHIADDVVVDWNASATADQQLTAADGGGLRGVVTDSVSGQALTAVVVQVFNTNGYVAGVHADGLGRYHVVVPSGSYWIRFVDLTHAHKSSWYGGPDFPTAQMAQVTNTYATADGQMTLWVP